MVKKSAKKSPSKRKKKKATQKKNYTKKENGKNNTGRPTKYLPEYCQDMLQYFLRCQAEILIDVKFFMPNKNVTVEKMLNPLAKESDEGETLQAGAVKSVEQKLVMTRFPTFIRYALSIGVDDDTIQERGKEHKEFSVSIERCKRIQEAILLENGLQGTYNSHFAQFVLKNNHGYKDKKEVDHSGELTLKNMLDEIIK